MSYSDEMYREIILDHIENPRNLNKEHNGYKEWTLKNPSCGDIITVYVKLKKDKIEDITYNGKGCSICMASASIMSELLKNKKIEETQDIIQNFNNMVIGNKYDESKLDEAISLKGVNKIPSRIKCATLAYKAFDSALKGGENDE